MSDFTLIAYVRSDVGKLRNNNEDNYRLLETFRDDVSVNNSEAFTECNDRRALFSVCDGMGGEEYGELASLIAVEKMRPAEYECIKDVANEDIISINAEILEMSKVKQVSRMGSTLANLYIDGGRGVAVNIGDSRIYLFRDGKLTRLSVDHDEVTPLIKMGILTEEQAFNDKRKHQLTQYLGMDDEEIIPEPFFSDEIKIASGDRFLLVSDGVTDLLTDDEISEILYKDLGTKETVNLVVDLALERKGHDNTTAMLVDIKENTKNFWELIRGWLHGD